jgi:hypothetical protein
MLFVTVHPEQVSKLVLESIDVVMTLGQKPDRTLKAFADRLGLTAPRTRREKLKVGEAIVWSVRSGEPPKTLRITPSDGERRRHRRKYAEGQLGPDRSFYFKGPRGELNLRAQNLTSFMQLAQGVDDATWTYHLKQGDYSRWMEVAIKDFPLARLIHQIENESALSAKDSRQRVTKAIEERYTWPAVGG